MTKLSLDQAAKIIDAAFIKGRDIDCRPLTVAVLDAWKNPLRYGMTGQVKLHSPAKSLGKSLTQKILRFVHSLNKD